MEPKIIFEDKAILVIDKPSGWIVNEAATTSDHPVLQSWLSKMDYQLAGSREFRSGIVHRLDKETSGILMVAKTKEAFENLQKQFKERKVEKTYTALVHGRVEPKTGEIKAPVGRLPWRRDRFGVLPGGKEAVTKYKVYKYYNNYSLLELFPKTGRTHQIRIHLKYIGHSIVSDEFYAGRKTARNDRNWCPRLFLHASSISFIHPTSEKRVLFKTGIPNDLSEALHNLQTSLN